MNVGMVATIVDEGTGAGAPDWPAVRDLALRVEAAGIDSLWVIDHLVMGNAERPEYGVHEAITILSALAAVTTRAELGTLVLATSFRPPAVLAKMAATIDRISGQAMSIISPLLEGERVTVEGHFYQVRDCALLPPPPRRIPILIAGKGERMLSLVAQHADQWNAAWFGRPNARYRGRVGDLHRALDVAGRDPATLEITVGVEVDNGDPADRTGFGEHVPADPSAIADALHEWAAEGVGHVQLNGGPTDARLVDIFAEAATRFRAG